ncbi:MAG: sulfur carrier protein ThiS [Acidimicrobiia bacterium]
MTAPAPVQVTVNGEPRDLAAGTTVEALVRDMGLEARGVAVAVDGEVVPKRRWGERTLAGGEHVEVLTIAQGG